MATVVLSAAGAAIGGSIGGTFAGLSSVAIGRAAGATLGKVIDQRLLGQGSDAVEHGKVDRFRLSSSGEGAPIARAFGRVRIAGQVIWASDFFEDTNVTGGGKGAPGQPQTTEFSYTVSLALALCQGEILRVGRVWADGEEVAPDDLNMRVYRGTDDQVPDPTIEAIEGSGVVPAYRGTAYVVMEDLPLGAFGNRVPQFSFEVVRAEQPNEAGADLEMARGIRAVALIPGTGEYSLATTPVHYTNGQGGRWTANVNTPAGKTDFAQSLEALTEEVPNCEAASLIVSWFGNDLRCGSCTVRPKIEKRVYDGENMPWTVSGLARADAEELPQTDGRPIYGGTPSDASVIEAIRAMNAAGQNVMFYPFILMDQQDDNDLPDPYSDATQQPGLPWRGRITLSVAPGRPGTPDRTETAEAEVDAFWGSASATDFVVEDTVQYVGPDEWSFSRFILHYAALCAAAGGVDAFCIGSELRGLTWIRGPKDRFVFVERLRDLAADVRALLGPETKISYAADWSEYFGYQPPEAPADRYFHLDSLWADDNIDFVGIDNYMPLSDWRDGEDHLDAFWGDVRNLDYLEANIAGGEGFDWYYHSVDARAAQIRTPITDETYDEPWVWRYKDIRGWWSNPHHERIGGVRSEAATAWVPGSKPIWFTEYGCAAVDKGTNQPNKFVDPKSSESSLPRYSNGLRDDLIQKQYYRAMHGYWTDPENNPQSTLYDGPMVDMRRAFAWAWDCRPFPFFPNNTALWGDGENYGRGHWINGRVAARALASVVAELSQDAGLDYFDTSKLYGHVRGYTLDQVADARSALQPLMLRHGFDAVERDGVLRFLPRTGRDAIELKPDQFAFDDGEAPTLEQTREAEAELMGRVRLRFIEADGDFEAIAEEAVLADDVTHSVSTSEIAMAMTRSEGRQVTERWLTEARLARDVAKFALPLSLSHVGAGDVVRLPAGERLQPETYRVDRSEFGPFQFLDAVRIDKAAYTPADFDDILPTARSFVSPVPPTAFFMDLPLISGDEVPHAPHVAASADPWPGDIAVYRSASEDGFALDHLIRGRAIMGITRSELPAAASGRLDRGPGLVVDLFSGTLSSVSMSVLLGGRNVAIIGDGAPGSWEVLQFRKADLTGPGQYTLRDRLRGQFGTEHLAASNWPEGSWFILLDGATTQIPLPSALRNVIQNYRIGPANKALDHPSYLQRSHAFQGNGLRPYAPVHFAGSVLDGGQFDLSWIRRTRIDGDNWDAPDVPLGEEIERYRIRVTQGGTLLREAISDVPNWRYTTEMQAADGASGFVDLLVAQLSSRFGAGPDAELRVSI